VPSQFGQKCDINPAGNSYPIESGVIEGACRHLVKDRMERSGMRWTLEGARSILQYELPFRATIGGRSWRTGSPTKSNEPIRTKT
jgi:hypothetical protein